MKENELIKYEGGLMQHVGKAISTTNKLLALSEQQKIISLFNEQPLFFLRLISKYYSLNKGLIEKYSNSLDWSLLSTNEALSWDDLLINRYISFWHWENLFRNKGILRSLWLNDLKLNLYEKYKSIWEKCDKLLPTSKIIKEENFEKWNWSHLSANGALPWTMDLIEKYEDKWSWATLSYNKGLPWTKELLEKYLDKWNWDKLSLIYPWTVDLVEKYKDKINWINLSWNNEFPWSDELVEKYEGRGNRMGLLLTFPYTAEMLKEYRGREIGLWECLSLNTKLNWSSELIDEFKENWDWASLSLNDSIPWSLSLLEKYKTRWRWSGISLTYGVWKNVFQKYLDDAMIEEVMIKISSNDTDIYQN